MEESLPIKMHRELGGKIHYYSDIQLENVADLALFYTPGVYDACLEIKTDGKKSNDFTGKKNSIAVISNGGSVAGFEDIGSLAVMPLLESKALVYKKLAGIDAVPLTINSKKADVIANTIIALENNFACVDITNISDSIYAEVVRLLEKLSIPVLNDEIHGLACSVYAGIINALIVSEKELSSAKIVIDSQSILSTKLSDLLKKKGAGNVVVCDKKTKFSAISKEADVLILFSNDVSFDSSIISKMNEKPIVFSLSYPVAAVTPDNAEKAGAFIVSSLRTDRPNQVTNAMAFPGLVKGLIESKSKKVTDEMLIACGDAIAESVRGEDFCGDYLLPTPFDENLVRNISTAVKKAKRKSSR